MTIRDTFLDVAATARGVLAAREVAATWDSPSALAELSVRGLAGHVVRGATSVEAYLDRGEPDEAPITAAEYYAAAVGEAADLGSAVNVGVRQKGEEMAAGGHAALVETLDGALDRLRSRLATEPAQRRVRVFRDLVLRLDDYLATRVVELVVHIDDLAVSVGVPTPDMPLDAAITTLVAVARHRHGDLAVLRALSRRERDPDDALRVL